MGALVKLIDAILFLFFIIIALGAPLIDSQMCLPRDYFPDLLIDLKQWYAREFDDYLFLEKPYFFIGLNWVELLFQWPLSLLNLYGIVARKPWFNTTCLLYGVSFTTSMVATLSEMILSKKASDKLLMIYCPFMGLGVLVTLRGLLINSERSSPAIGKRPAMAREKKA